MLNITVNDLITKGQPNYTCYTEHYIDGKYEEEVVVDCVHDYDDNSATLVVNNGDTTFELVATLDTVIQVDV